MDCQIIPRLFPSLFFMCHMTCFPNKIFNSIISIIRLTILTLQDRCKFFERTCISLITNVELEFGKTLQTHMPQCTWVCKFVNWNKKILKTHMHQHIWIHKSKNSKRLMTWVCESIKERWEEWQSMKTNEEKRKWNGLENKGWK